ncbi:MAG: hypothetical protein QM785_06305 [Pyrinomonadaceae bacterium]
MDDIRETFGGIDIYLFDQIQKGRFSPGMKILDAGCGGGRNIHWLLRNGYQRRRDRRHPRACKTVCFGAFAGEFSGRVARRDAVCGREF